MSYASITDIIARAGETEVWQIADRDRDGALDQPVIDAALTHADNMIDGYVGVRYAVPLASVPDLVRTWAVSIARYMLHRNGAPDHVGADYKEAVAALKDVARGQIALPVAVGADPLSTASGTIMSDHPAEVFTADRLRGF